MKTVQVKICGIRSMESAVAAIEAGADFLGFNFVPASKRYVTLSFAKTIIDAVRHRVKIVGVFQDADIKTINDTIALLDLNFVQLHGKEGPAFCKNITKPVIKAFNLVPDFDYEVVSSVFEAYDVAYYMVDREKQGEGKRLDAESVKPLGDMFPLFVGGGLTIENISKVIANVQPFAVDVASGIETNGKEDLEKIKRFISNAKGVHL